MEKAPVDGRVGTEFVAGDELDPGNQVNKQVATQPSP